MIAWLHALKKRYEADEAEHTATIDTFLQNHKLSSNQIDFTF